MINLKNQEFTFDVDMSNLPCGLNGALYLSAMDADGGLSKFTGNKAGAKYGTGYCDSQCPQDIKFINGEVRLIAEFVCDSVLTLAFITGEHPRLERYLLQLWYRPVRNLLL